jgi:cobalt-zinc-cadmium efflux system outer membrane protein
MTKGFFTVLLVVAGVGTLSGCAATNHDGFIDVRRTVAERTGRIVEWDGQTSDDQAAHKSVHGLLAQDLTADQAVQVALLNNHNLQATFEDLGIAQADLVQAGLLKNPVFNLGVRFPTTPPSQTYLDISVAEDFINVFFIPARRKLAQSQLNKAKAQVTDQVFALAFETKSAFYSYQAAEQLLELRQNIDRTAAASATAAKRLHDAGNSTDLEFLNSQTQAARATADLADAEANAAQARERLNDLMGLWGEDTVWSTGDRLPDLPSTEVQSHGLESLAIRQRADLAAAREEIEVQAQTLGFTAETRLLTEANIGAEGERETDGQWRIGPSLSVPLPLFDQGQGAIPRAQAVLRQSEQRYWALAVDIRSQVRAACERMLSARRKAEYLHDHVLPLEVQVVQQTHLQYNGMFVGVFALLEARREQIDAAREYIEALRDYWAARADLERAVGGRLPDSRAVAATKPTATPEPSR